MKPTKKPSRMELGSEETTALIRFMTVISEFEDNIHKLSLRASNAGVKDLLIKAQKDNIECLRKMMLTVPKDKRDHFLATLDNMRVRISIENDTVAPMAFDATKHYDYICVPRETANFLLNNILESECLFCDKSGAESQCCQLKKHINNVFLYKIEEEDDDHCKFSNMHYLLK